MKNVRIKYFITSYRDGHPGAVWGSSVPSLPSYMFWNASSSSIGFPNSVGATPFFNNGEFAVISLALLTEIWWQRRTNIAKLLVASSPIFVELYMMSPYLLLFHSFFKFNIFSKWSEHPLHSTSVTLWFWTNTKIKLKLKASLVAKALFTHSHSLSSALKQNVEKNVFKVLYDVMIFFIQREFTLVWLTRRLMCSNELK